MHCAPRCCRVCCHESRNLKNLEWNLQMCARLGMGGWLLHSTSQGFAFHGFVSGGRQVQILCCDVRLVQQAFRDLSHLIEKNVTDHCMQEAQNDYERFWYGLVGHHTSTSPSNIKNLRSYFGSSASTLSCAEACFSMKALIGGRQSLGQRTPR